MATKHRHAQRIHRDTDSFTATDGPLIQGVGVIGSAPTIINMDPPELLKRRRVLSHAFTPKAIGKLEDGIRRRAAAMIDRLLAAPQAMLLVVPNGKVKLLNALPFSPADLRVDSISGAWSAYRDAWQAPQVRDFVLRCRMEPALLYPVQHGSEQAQQDRLRIKLRDSLVRARVGVINSLRFTLKSLG